MATRAKVDYRDVEELILFRLHLALAKRENFDSTPEHLAGELHIPPQLIRICADRLVADDLCRTRNVESFGEHPITGDDASYTETLIEVTEKGIDHVQGWNDEKYRSVAHRSTLPVRDWEFDESANTENKEGVSQLRPQAVPAADRYVSRNDNQALWDQTSAALDRVIAEFAEDHHLDNRFGPEKGALKKALEAGRSLFDDVRVNVRLGAALILEPLRTIRARYEDAIAAGIVTAGVESMIGLVKIAIDAVSKLFGNG